MGRKKVAQTQKVDLKRHPSPNTPSICFYSVYSLGCMVATRPAWVTLPDVKLVLLHLQRTYSALTGLNCTHTTSPPSNRLFQHE